MIDVPELVVQVSAGRTPARLPLLRRAVAGTCSQAGLPVDRMYDAIVILEALLADVRTARADEVQLTLTARPGSFALLMGPFPDSEAELMLGATDLPSAGPIVEQLATSARSLDDGSRLLVVVDAA